jgi:hypothetical protein
VSGFDRPLFPIIVNALWYSLICVFAWLIFHLATTRFETAALAFLIILFAAVRHSRIRLDISLSRIERSTNRLLQQAFPNDSSLIAVIGKQEEETKEDKTEFVMSFILYVVLCLIGVWKLISVVVL